MRKIYKSAFMSTLQDRFVVQHKSYKTEQAYMPWIDRFIRFHAMQHPSTMNTSHLEKFIIDLANTGSSASTQGQAIAAIKFMFREMTDVEIGDVRAIISRRDAYIPTALTVEEVKAIMCRLRGVYHIIGQILYGCGLRLMECMRLRVKDVDFDHKTITLHGTKSNRDRVTVLPSSVIIPLKLHLAKVKAQHDQDLVNGYGSVETPGLLAKKSPGAQYSWGWQYVFPSGQLSMDPRSNIVRRHHLFETSVQKNIRRAALDARITKPVGPHTLRHAFATHLYEQGVDVVRIQKLLGHKDVKTTMGYIHPITVAAGIVSPADRLEFSDPAGL